MSITKAQVIDLRDDAIALIQSLASAAADMVESPPDNAGYCIELQREAFEELIKKKASYILEEHERNIEP